MSNAALKGCANFFNIILPVKNNSTNFIAYPNSSEKAFLSALLMRNFFIYIVFVQTCFLFKTATAQHYFYNNEFYEPELMWEAGISAGGMNCLTDLGGNRGTGGFFIKDVNWKNTKPCVGLYAKVLYNHFIGVRLETNFGSVSAYDNILKNDGSLARYRYQRNLHFRSTISEASILAELHPLAWGKKVQENPSRISPYLAAGIGYFHFSPQAKLNEQWFDLHPLHTEGQGFKQHPEKNSYKLSQFNFPLVIGLQYEASALMNIGIEFTYRLLQTDYLDDVSGQYIDPSLFSLNMDAQRAAIAEQISDRRATLNPGNNFNAGEIRGNADHNDAYFSFNIKMGLILNRSKRR